MSLTKQLMGPIDLHSIFFLLLLHTMEVTGALRNSNKFGTTWGWENDDHFHFWVNYPFEWSKCIAESEFWKSIHCNTEFKLIYVNFNILFYPPTGWNHSESETTTKNRPLMHYAILCQIYQLWLPKMWRLVKNFGNQQQLLQTANWEEICLVYSSH